MISRSTTDVLRLQDFFFACLLLSFDIVVSLIAIIWLIWLASPVLAMITVATAAPTIGLIAFYASKLQPAMAARARSARRDDDGDPGKHRRRARGEGVCEGTAEVEKFREKKQVFLDTLLRTVNYWAARVPFAQFIFGLSMPLILWVGGRQVIQGEARDRRSHERGLLHHDHRASHGHGGAVHEHRAKRQRERGADSRNHS